MPSASVRTTTTAKPGRFREGSARQPQIPDRLLPEAHAARVAALLLHLLDAADLQAGQPGSLARRMAAANVLLRDALDVEPELVVELTFDGPAPEDGAEAVPEIRRASAPPTSCP